MPTLPLEIMARIAHEVNRAYCKANYDESQVAWDVAPQWQRDSCIDGVQFHIDNPDAAPSMSHDNWLKLKEAEGWRFGPVKNEALKTHPCMKPFDQLPAVERVKDHLFAAVVRACMTPDTAPVVAPAPKKRATKKD